MIGREGDKIVEIHWTALPGRTAKFLELWMPAAEAALDFGASAQIMIQSVDNPAVIVQYAAFPDKLSFERYWISEEIAEARAQIIGLFQLPLLPVWHDVVSASETAEV